MFCNFSAPLLNSSAASCCAFGSGSGFFGLAFSVDGFAGFISAMIRRGVINEIWLLSVPEIELDVCKERGLVPFDGEVIVGLTFSDQIVGEVALG